MDQSSRPQPEAIALELDALARLTAARDALDLILAGHWLASPPLLVAVGQLVDTGRRLLLWTEAVVV